MSRSLKIVSCYGCPYHELLTDDQLEEEGAGGHYCKFKADPLEYPLFKKIEKLGLAHPMPAWCPLPKSK